MSHLVLIHNPPRRDARGRFLPRKGKGKGKPAAKGDARKVRPNPPSRAGIISVDVHELRYRHAENGENYFHPFRRNDVELIAMSDGTLRLRSRSGRPLWQEFPDGAR